VIGRPIRSLEFKDCAFSEEVFRAVFQTIFFDATFHSLINFGLEGFELGAMATTVLELSCCAWAMQSKCLRNISLSNSGVDGAEFLSQFLRFDIGLRDITLSGCDLSRPLRARQISVRDFDGLVLNSARNVSLDFFRSFFSLLHEQRINVTKLNFSNLDLLNVTDFLGMLSGHPIGNLQVIEFDGNRMNSAQTVAFSQVIEKNPEIVSVSMNCSIDITDSPAGLAAFIGVVSNRQMARISIRSDGSIKFSFGSLLLPLLNSQTMLGLSVLDVTNQAIGERGLGLLRRVLERGALTELYFDGSSVDSFPFLVEFCQAVIASKLRFAEFPTQDFDKLLRLRRTGVDDREQIDQREQIYRTFMARFDPSVERSRAKPLTKAKPLKIAAVEAPAPSPPKPRLSDDWDRTVPDAVPDAMKINPATFELYRECVPGSAGMDGILDLMRSLQETLSLEALYEAIS
jgi:hypothetical protein